MSAHYSDEDLLRALDGELSRLHAYAVREHLRTCWRCRDRQAELEEQIRAVVRSLRDSPPTGPEWMAVQKEQLRKSQLEWEAAQVPEPVGVSGMRWAGRRYAPAFAAAVALAAAGLWTWRSGESPRTYEPRAVLAEAVRTEALPESASLAQEFRVEYVLGEAAEGGDGGRLTLWADGGGERFASRWADASGGIGHYAVRSQGRDYVYDRRRRAGALAERKPAAAPVALTTVLQKAETTAEIASGFVQWLESRDWEPLSLSGELARFADASGVSLEVRRVEAEGREALLLVAQRTLAEGETARMIVELDVHSLEVRRQRLEIVSPARRAAIVFTPERRERFTLATMPSAPFDVALIEQELRAPVAMGRGGEAAPAPTASELGADEARAVERQADDAALDLLLALHGERLCDSGNVTLERQGDHWTLTVVAPRREEALRLRRMLQPGATRALRVQVVSAEEAIGELGGAGAPLGSAADGAGPQRSEPSELAIGEALRRHFAANGDPDEAIERVAALSRDAVRISQQLLRDAQAIDRILLLTEERPELREDARAVRMLGDHGASLVRGAGNLGELLEAPLRAVAPRAAAPVSSGGPEQWIDLRESLWRTDQLVNVLLAGADSSGEGAAAGRSAQGWEVSAQLLKELDEVSAGAVRWLAGLRAAKGERE